MCTRLRLTARTLPRHWRSLLLAAAGAATPGSVSGQPKTGAVAGDAAQHFARGVELERKGDWSGAAAAFEAALERAPDMARACNRLGFALGQLGRTTDAIARFRQAAAMRRSSSTRTIISAPRCGGRAISMARSPRCGAPWSSTPGMPKRGAFLGVVLRERGDTLGAVEHLRAAIRENAAIARAHMQLGVALQTLGNLDGAEAGLAQGPRPRPRLG